MKKILYTLIKNVIILAFCLPLFVFGQQKDLTYDHTQDVKFVEQYKNNTVIDSYTTKDGLIIKIGDTLIIGNAIIKKKKRKKYLFNDVFSYIVIGKTKGTTNKEFKYLPHNYSGNKVIVKSLFVTHEKFTGYKLLPNRKEMPLYVSLFVRQGVCGDIGKAVVQGEGTYEAWAGDNEITGEESKKGLGENFEVY